MKTNLFIAIAFIMALALVNPIIIYGAKNEASVDVTSKVINPEFDNAAMTSGAPYGWSQTVNAATSKISTAAKGDGSVIFADENHWQLWNGGAATGKAYQTIINLPSGKYTLRAGLYTEFGGNVYLYANETKTAISSKVSAYYEAIGIVTNGTLEIGLDITTTGGTTIEFDHITLHYQGNDKTALNNAITDAEQLYGDGTGIKADMLLTAINNAKTISGNDNASMTEIDNITNTLLQAISTYKYANVTAENPVDMTSHIKNPSFESNGLANWTNSGMWTQTNNSPTWTKDGNVYVEKWVGSGALSNGSISQNISGLPDGKYRLKASAHATKSSGTTKGVYLYAGIDETLVTASGEYVVETVVIGETIEIGFKINSTDATWVAIDNFRLYHCGEDIELYKTHLAKKLEQALKDTTTSARPKHYFNIEQYREAINEAKTADLTDIDQVAAAIRMINKAAADRNEIIAAYSELKNTITRLNTLYKKTTYAQKETIKTKIDEAQTIYSSDEDQRATIGTILVDLEKQIQLLTTFDLLWSKLIDAKRLYRESDYPNRTTFKAAIDAAQKVSTKEEIYAAISSLADATTAYLSGRPATDWTTIKNGALWQDNRGKSVQAHGAGFLQVGDTWYMIGEDRETAVWNPDVNMYSSKDFVNWKFERKIIQNGKHSFTYSDGSVGTLGSNRMIERPKLLYCAKTGKYIVWCHWEAGNYGASEAAVFYCDSINGEYKLHWAGRPLGVKSRDCTVFQDDNGKAYFVSTTSENQHIGLFELSDDYLSAVKHTELFSWQSREAPAIVKVNGTYFMISSACSGWDPNQAKISYSKSLESGWSSNVNIGSSISFDTQPASILPMQSASGTSYIYVGDRWQDPGLAESKTIMFPVTFSGNSCNFTYRSQFDLNMATGQWRETSTENRVPKTAWKILDYSSQETSGENGAAANAIDGKLNTKWHTKYSGGTAAAPHHISVDMGAEYDVAGFLCTSRMDNTTNGLIREYMFLLSLDGENWEMVSGGTWLPYSGEIAFTPTRARYFRMVATAGTYACIVELDMIKDTGDYTPRTMVLNTKVGSTAWSRDEEITANVGQNVSFNSTTSGSGFWKFYGPNNRTGTSNTASVSAVTKADAGIYSFAHTTHYCQAVSRKVKITVIDPPSSLNNPIARKEVERQYYNLQGMEIKHPERNQVYIVKKKYDDGSKGTEKIVYKESY